MRHSEWARTKLYAKRKERGLSMKEVYALTGVTPARLSEYERALSEPSVTRALRLANFFGASVEELFS